MKNKGNKKWRFSQGLGPTKILPKLGDILCPPATRATWYFQIFIQILKKKEEKTQKLHIEIKSD